VECGYDGDGTIILGSKFVLFVVKFL